MSMEQWWNGPEGKTEETRKNPCYSVNKTNFPRSQGRCNQRLGEFVGLASTIFFTRLHTPLKNMLYFQWTDDHFLIKKSYDFYSHLSVTVIANRIHSSQETIP
jgi:hypothetical protein